MALLSTALLRVLWLYLLWLYLLWLYLLWQVAAELEAEKSGRKPGPHHAPANLEMQRAAQPHRGGPGMVGDRMGRVRACPSPRPSPSPSPSPSLSPSPSPSRLTLTPDHHISLTPRRSPRTKGVDTPYTNPQVVPQPAQAMAVAAPMAAPQPQPFMVGVPAGVVPGRVET